MKNIIIILISLLLTTMSFGQIIATKETHSIDNTLQKLELNCGIEKAYLCSYRVASEFNWNILTSDTKIYAFTAETPKTMKRWDDYVNVYFDTVDENKSIINIKSKLGHKPNKEYITLYLTTLEEKINNSIKP
jgi:hypothetical protein